MVKKTISKKNVSSKINEWNSLSPSEQLKVVLKDKKWSKRGHPEDDLQKSAVTYLRNTYPDLTVFSVPNGGKRDKVTAAIQKSTGTMPGVSDLIIIDHICNEFPVIFMEFKSGTKGRQSERQREFQEKVQLYGHPYVICRSLDDVINVCHKLFKNHIRNRQKFKI